MLCLPVGLSSQNSLQPTSHHFSWRDLDHMTTLKSEPIRGKDIGVTSIGLDGSEYTSELGTGSLPMRMSKIRTLSARHEGEIDAESTVASPAFNALCGVVRHLLRWTSVVCTCPESIPFCCDIT